MWLINKIKNNLKQRDFKCIYINIIYVIEQRDFKCIYINIIYVIEQRDLI